MNAGRPTPPPADDAPKPNDTAERTDDAPPADGANSGDRKSSWAFERRRPESPRRIRNGLKLTASDGVVGRTWASRRLVSLIDARFSPEARREGLDYAKRGQTAKLDVGPGRIDASVQGRAPRRYKIRIDAPRFDESQWEQAIALMAEDARFAAQMLEGDVPSALDELLASHDETLALIPRRPERLDIACTCDEPDPCKHAAAVLYLVAERFDAASGLVFELRGLSLTQVIDRLHQIRALQTQGGSSGSYLEPVLIAAQPAAPKLEDAIEHFWRMPHPPDDDASVPEVHHADHALLRRLGPSPLDGKFPLSGLLASIYDVVSESSREMRDAAESDEDAAGEEE